ncbi:hypothetical protein P9850_12185 [Anoxybacillus rupiensis]|uniref:Uncharacterized protein n=1 Tax=Anoxybacteroides rupiense TaxID=311460 RepID=A0ABD5IZ07_9BACL|nr:hypothetical protein [Anoxybacillus rupiensis]
MSYLDVYNQELELLVDNPQGLRERLTAAVYKRLLRSETLRYTFVVPASYYLRGEMLCEDISELGEMNYTHQDLLSLLIDDFVRQIRKLSDPDRIYHELVLRDCRPVKINSKRAAKDHHLTQSKIIEIECRMKRSLALRLEVLLADIAELHPGAEFTLEDVLQILYCDFIEAYKQGRLKNIVQRIIEDSE